MRHSPSPISQHFRCNARKLIKIMAFLCKTATHTQHTMRTSGMWMAWKMESSIWDLVFTWWMRRRWQSCNLLHSNETTCQEDENLSSAIFREMRKSFFLPAATSCLLLLRAKCRAHSFYLFPFFANHQDENSFEIFSLTEKLYSLLFRFR